METKKHHTIAVRMGWLAWLTRPLVKLWGFLVRMENRFWSIVKISWEGMKKGFALQPALIATASTAAGLLLLGLIVYLGNLPDSSVVLKISIVIGVILFYGCILWGNTEITECAAYTERKAKPRKLQKINLLNGKGAQAVLMMTGLLLIALILTLLLVLLCLPALVPHLGLTFSAVLSIPALFVAGVLTLMIVLFGYSLQIIPALLQDIRTDNIAESLPRPGLYLPFTVEGLRANWKIAVYIFRRLGQSLNWLRLPLSTLPTACFGILASLPVWLLLFASLALLTSVFSGLTMAISSSTDSLFNLQPILSSIGQTVSKVTDLAGSGWQIKVSRPFMLITLSIVIGLSTAMLRNTSAVTSYYLVVQPPRASRHSNMSFAPILNTLLLGAIVTAVVIAVISFRGSQQTSPSKVDLDFSGEPNTRSTLVMVMETPSLSQTHTAVRQLCSTGNGTILRQAAGHQTPATAWRRYRIRIQRGDLPRMYRRLYDLGQVSSGSVKAEH